VGIKNSVVAETREFRRSFHMVYRAREEIGISNVKIIRYSGSKAEDDIWMDDQPGQSILNPDLSFSDISHR
jgi:hypothetical protein